MSVCIDPKFREMLHAFELDMLSESDRNLLEAHLVECESCFEEARRMLGESEILRHDPEIKSIIKTIESETEHQEKPVLRRIKELLWPENPKLSFIKPLTVLILLAAISYPVYRIGFHKSRIHRQTINLFPMRGAERNIVNPEEGGEVIINFVVEDVSPGREYILSIRNHSGELVYFDSTFSDFKTSV